MTDEDLERRLPSSAWRLYLDGAMIGEIDAHGEADPRRRASWCCSTPTTTASISRCRRSPAVRSWKTLLDTNKASRRDQSRSRAASKYILGDDRWWQVLRLVRRRRSRRRDASPRRTWRAKSSTRSRFCRSISSVGDRRRDDHQPDLTKRPRRPGAKTPAEPPPVNQRPLCTKPRLKKRR